MSRRMKIYAVSPLVFEFSIWYVFFLFSNFADVNFVVCCVFFFCALSVKRSLNPGKLEKVLASCLLLISKTN